jgi:peptidoglycan hydrolase-like protein with peptidoglycan-binding domain/glutaredoxin 2
MKKLLAMTVAASLVMSSAVYASEAVTGGSRGVDVVSAATGETPAPAPKPTPKPTAPAPKPVPKPATPAPKPATPAPAAADAATTLVRIVKLGSKGTDVKMIQSLLNKNGFTLKADGIFGKLTLGAVKSYQAKNGLKADGIVGKLTFSKLNPVVVIPTPIPPAPTTPVDAVTTASIVNDAAAFEKAISKDGTWIIATLKDITINKDLVLTGALKNGKKDKVTGLDAVQRKIALYTQDDKKNVTARFTLTAPKLTILSPNARIQSGTFKGDLYVSVSGFQLVDAKVDGNVYFTTQDAKDTFVMDAKSSITGKQELVAVDAVSTASLVNNEAAFEQAISKDGKWIIGALKNLTFTKELVLDGEFKNGKKDAVTGADIIQRKIALYSQDDKKVTTGRFTVTAPKLTILSPNASIQKGIFKGDIYVKAANFKLVDALVDGNIYFTTQEAKDTFVKDATSVITGKQILADVDAVSTASLVNDAAAFEKAISKDGTWIIATLRDLTTDKALEVEGEFHDKNLAANALKRKIGLYTHNDPADKKKATHSFTLTAPSLTIKSPSTTLQYGFFVGDIYVESNNFNLTNIKVDGNIYFTTQEAKDTFTMTNSTVTGKQELKTN